MNITLIQNYLKEIKSSLYEKSKTDDFLKELHLTEGRNTGFKKILDVLDANSSPKPEFETDEAHSYFITRLFIHEAFLEEKSGKSSDSTPKSTPSTSKSTSKSTPSVKKTEKVQELSLRKQEIVLIKENPTISKKRMTEMLGISMYALKKELSAMNKEHVAERTEIGIY